MISGDPQIPYLLKTSLRDPLKLHPYLYVKANPINRIDPRGLACGPGKFGDYFVPDGFIETYSFSDACSIHDACYGCEGEKAGKSKIDDLVKSLYSVIR